jgi:hypothetical protein
VDLTLAHRNDVLAVPVPAVDVSSGNESVGQVAVVTPDNRIEMREIQLGLQTPTSVEVRSGLHAGDLVVTGNRASLQAGQRVRPKLTEAVAETTPQ